MAYPITLFIVHHAGFLAKLIFSIGIIGLGLLAMPVLSGSAAYAVCEAFAWDSGLNLKWNRAKAFYLVICVATLIGLMINFIGIDPVKALVYAAVLNGVAAVPLLFLIVTISGNKSIMGGYKNGRYIQYTALAYFFGHGGGSYRDVLYDI